MQHLFGTDGIRGTTEPDVEGKRQLRLTPELALRVGHAAGRLACDHTAGGRDQRVILGRDSRISGMMLESALIAGLLAQGVDAVQVGVIPTPGVAFLTPRCSAQLGIVLSASHNPVGDNGIKFFGHSGYKLEDDLEATIESWVMDPDFVFAPRATRELGRLEPDTALQQSYVNYLVQSWRGREDLTGRLVLLECTNGATCSIAPEVFQRLGARVQVVNGTPDGLNINQSYEYVDPRRFGELVVEREADFGVCFDGDGDRVIMVDETGRVVDGDTIIAILARDMLSRGRLPGRAVVTTNMSNFGLHSSLREVGVEVVETQVGDKFVMRKMMAEGYTLGGERSGHILILDGEQTTGDGIYTALAVAAVLADSETQRLSQLAAVMSRYPQFIGSVAIPPGKPPLEEMQQVRQIVRRLEAEIGFPADIHLRYSGTEDKLRLSVRGWVEGDAEQMVAAAQQALQQLGQAIVAHTTG